VGLILIGTHQLPVYANDVNVLRDNIDTIKKLQELYVGLEVNTIYVAVSS
jgi:hypothetical protein